MDEEIFDVVDDEDNVIGQAPRSVVHAKGLGHRSVVWFEFETDAFGRIYVSQRSIGKEFDKGQWSIVLGGHVLAGEPYQDAVTREHGEETGLQGEPVYMASFRKSCNPLDQENVRVYGFMEGGKAPRLEKAEFIWGGYMDDAQLGRKLKDEIFLPETPILLGILGDYRNAVMH